MGILSNVLPMLSSVISPKWTIYKDFKYGPWDEQLIDLYLLDSGVRPVVIFIHGGGWSSGDKSAYAGRAKRYALAGFHVIAMNYRLAKIDLPGSWWPAQIADVLDVMSVVRRDAMAWRIDPSRIGVCGDSAGAHLALMLGTTDAKPTCILDMYGPTDLGAPGMRELIEALPLFGGCKYAAHPDVYDNASPLKQATAFFPPTMIMQGSDDQTVPPTQSYAMAAKLISCGVDCTLTPFAGGHDLSKLSAADQLSIEMAGLRWFVSKLRP